MTEHVFAVPPEQDGMRLDHFLALQCPELSRSALQQRIRAGDVRQNGSTATKAGSSLKAGDQIRLTLPPPQPARAQAQEIPLEIVYEDTDLLVVNKPKGMVVHPAAGNPDGTLVNALLWHCAGQLSGIGGELRPGIVHRIDKDTSGLLVVAKTDVAHLGLARQLEEHSMRRVYQAVVYGKPSAEGFVEAPLGRHRTDRKKMAIVADGRYAYTGYRVLRQYQGFAHIACQLKTGRTHQIRVHMASIGHPLAGDAVYGPKKCIASLQGQCLHAKTLGFVHPITGQQMDFDSELPAYFTQFLSTLKETDE